MREKNKLGRNPIDQWVFLGPFRQIPKAYIVTPTCLDMYQDKDKANMFDLQLNFQQDFFFITGREHTNLLFCLFMQVSVDG